jgi:hypothetical protein
VRGGDEDICSLSDECLGRGETKAAAASGHEVDPVAQSEIHQGILAQRRRDLDRGSFGQAKDAALLNVVRVAPQAGDAPITCQV